MPTGAIVKLDGRIVLATAYGQNPACLCQDLAFDREPTPADVVRAARKWEITHTVEDYRDVVREFVPEARFDNYAPEDDNFVVRADTVLTNKHDLVQFCTRTHDYYVVHGDTPGGVDMDEYLASQGLQKGTKEAMLVRQNEIIRKYIDLGRILQTKVTDPNDMERLFIWMQELEVSLEASGIFYNMHVQSNVECRSEFGVADPGFSEVKPILLKYIRSLLQQIEQIASRDYHESLKTKINEGLERVRMEVVLPIEGFQTVEEFNAERIKSISLFDFEDAKEEKELLEMGLDPDWIKTYFDIGLKLGSPGIEVLRRKYLR